MGYCLQSCGFIVSEQIAVVIHIYIYSGMLASWLF